MHPDIEKNSLSQTALMLALAIIFLWFGALKFVPAEATGLEGLVNNSPIVFWIHDVMSPRTFANILGVIEIIIGVLLLGGLKNMKLRALGGLGGIVTFLVTLSFMFTTPGVVYEGRSFPILSAMPGEFLLKDLVLLAASFAIFMSAKETVFKKED